jgi:hypothetical protein
MSLARSNERSTPQPPVSHPGWTGTLDSSSTILARQVTLGLQAISQSTGYQEHRKRRELLWSRQATATTKVSARLYPNPVGSISNGRTRA